MPNTIIKILTNIDLDNEYQHSFTFPNLEYQLAFFNGKLKHEIEDSTYIGEFFKNDFININEPIEDLIDCTYLMYQNTDSSEKYYYCFITDLEVINNENTKVYFKLDVLQTFKFDVDYHESFIEREHVASDVIGEHLKNENLDIGEMVGYLRVMLDLDRLGFFVGVTETPAGVIIPANILQNVYAGLTIYGFSEVSNLNSFIATYTANQGAIKFIFTYPLNLLATWRSGLFFEGIQISDGDLDGYTERILDTQNSLAGYFPKNNKCFTYPFSYLQMTNFSGTIRNFKREGFGTQGYFDFEIDGAFSVGADISCTPLEYNASYFDSDVSLIIANLPVCSWVTDVYSQWLNTSKVTLPLSLATQGLGLATSLLTKNPIGIASGVISVASSIGGIYEKSLEPNTYNGSNGSNLNVANERATFGYKFMSPKYEFIERIDNYFSFYGYNVSQFKNFDFENRTNWNYIKVIDPNITGNIQPKYLTEYKEVFKKGVTFWHNDNIGNYDRSN